MIHDNGTYTAVIDAGRIRYHPENYNGHDADNLAALQDSLGIHGYVRRIVVQEDGEGEYICVAGEGVLTALKMEAGQGSAQSQEGGLQLEATVIPGSWPPERVEAYLVADNELARRSDPEPVALRDLLRRLQADHPDVAAGGTGVDQERYKEIVAAAKRVEEKEREAEPEGEEPDHDEAKANKEAELAALTARWGVAEGQIWRLGRHTMLIGDSTAPASWERLLDAAGLGSGDVAGLFTSPPYAEQRLARYGGVPAENFVRWWLDTIDPLARRYLRPDGSLLINLKAHAEDGRRHTYDKRLVIALEEGGDGLDPWLYFEEWSWLKPARPGEYPHRCKNAFEPVHHFTWTGEPRGDILAVAEARTAAVTASYRPLAEAQGYNQRTNKETDLVRPSNVLRINHDRTGVAGDTHPARFPVALPAFFMQAYSLPGDAWLDFFGGTGSTLIAAEREDRVGLLIELQPQYAAIALERYVLEADGNREEVELL